MSKLKQLELQYEKEKTELSNEKIRLKGELDQVRIDKTHYKIKADIPAFNNAVNNEKQINHKLQMIESDLISLEKKINKLKQEEKHEKDKLERERKQKEKQKQTRIQMDSVLRYIKQGKTRNEAAKLVGIKEYKISHWCREGELGTNKNTQYFYNEITKIEKELEEKTRKEHNRKMKRDKIEQNSIKEFMQDILLEMENGKSRQQAAQIIGIKYSKVNEWYEKGSKHENNDFYQFYKKINEIENSPEYSQDIDESNLSEEINRKSTSLVTVNYCQNCGKKLSDGESNYCSNCGSSLIEVKNKYEKQNNFGSQSKSTVSTNSGKCCLGLMVIFVVIAILIVVV